MSTLQLIVLALVQGITEFLPISSSGHLILVPLLTEWPDQGLLIDVAVHVGTLGAVVLYLIRELVAMARALVTPRHPEGAGDRRMILHLAVATLPIIIVGLIVNELVGDALRSLEVIAWAMILFGILLWVVDTRVPHGRRLDSMSLRDALVIGLAQVLALIPGTSRAGITMTAARALGYDRTESARFSMLLSIPTILAAGAILALELGRLGDTALTSDALFAGALALLSALVAIVLMMRWLRNASFTPFVVYRLVLGAILLWIAYT